MSKSYQQLSSLSHRWVLVNFAVLLVVFSLNTLVWPSCARSPNWVIWIIHVLPLVVFIPGLIKQNIRSFIWMTMILLGFFMASVSTAFACKSALMLTEVILIGSLFTSAMLYIRWRSRALKQATENQES